MIPNQRSIDEPLWPYQEKSVQYITGGISGRPDESVKVAIYASKVGRAILYIDAGLGKSRIAMEACMRLCPEHKILVVCSKKALNTWRREWPKWTTLPLSQLVIIEGSPAKRKKLWASPAQVFVITYQSGMRDYEHFRRHHFRMCIADECKLMRSRKTKAFKFWAPKFHNIPYMLPMDGTLATRGPQDLWTFLNILKPKLFSSFWKYAKAFIIIHDGPFGKEFLGPQNTKALGSMLATNMIRIKDDDPEVIEQRPPLTRDTIPVDMTEEQKGLYETLVEELMVVTEGGELIIAPSALALTIRLRQLLICPMMLDPALANGASMDHLLLELADDPHVVVYTPFAKALPFIQEAIWENHPPPYILKGGTPSDVVGHIEEEFDKDKNKDRAVICTITFAESFELPSAKQCFFLGYDWSQLTNYQAEKRLHRLTTPHPVNAHYYKYAGTIDDDILEVLNFKEWNVKTTFQDYISAIRRRTRQ